MRRAIAIVAFVVVVVAAPAQGDDAGTAIVADAGMDASRVRLKMTIGRIWGSDQLPTSFDVDSSRIDAPLAERECTDRPRTSLENLYGQNCLDVRAAPISRSCSTPGCRLDVKGRSLEVKWKPQGRLETARVTSMRDELGRFCQDTFLFTIPVAKIQVTNQPARQLQVRVEYDRSTEVTIYVRTDDGRWFCDRGRKKQCETSTRGCVEALIPDAPSGEYAIFLGTSDTEYLDDTTMALSPGELSGSVTVRVAAVP